VIRRRISRPTRLRPADAVGEACIVILAKPARALVTSLGTLLGVAWFVTALGLASTAGGQVTSAFAHRLPTHVLISPKQASPAPASAPCTVSSRPVFSGHCGWVTRLSYQRGPSRPPTARLARQAVRRATDGLAR
jgi:hypothetical protein